MSSSSFTAWRKAGNNMLCWHIVDTATFHHAACHRRSRRVISSYSTDSEWPHRWRHLLNNFGSHQIFSIFHYRPGDAPPKKLPIALGDPGPHIKCGSLGPSKSTPQMASRLVQPFLHGLLQYPTDTHTQRNNSNNRTHLMLCIVMQTKK